MKLHQTHMPTFRYAQALPVLLSAVMTACSANSTTGVSAGAGAQSTATKTTDSADTPDKPASISGAYLTGYTPKIKPTDPKICSGVRLVQPNGTHVSIKQIANIKFSYNAASAAAAGANPITVTNLAGSASKQYFFDVLYCMKLPAATAGTTLSLTNTATGTTTTKSARTQALTAFLASVPVFSAPRLLSSITATPSPTPAVSNSLHSKTGAGLSLADAGKNLRLTAAPAAFGDLQTPVGLVIPSAVGAAPTVLTESADQTTLGVNADSDTFTDSSVQTQVAAPSDTYTDDPDTGDGGTDGTTDGGDDGSDGTVTTDDDSDYDTVYGPSSGDYIDPSEIETDDIDLRLK